MKSLIFLIFFIVLDSFQLSDSFAQSPYYSLKFKLNENADRGLYKVIHRICSSDLLKIGDWFSHDTSQVNWSDPGEELLNSFECGIANDEIKAGDEYKYGNQHMLFENILNVSIIENASSDTMHIVFPAKLKSFLTFIDLGNINFRKGIYDITSGLSYSFEDIKAIVSIRKDFEWKPVESNVLLMNK